MPGTLYILTGPSGVGKTTVAKRLVANRPNLKKVTTCTTRPPREGERDGVDYHFVSEEAFEDMIGNDELFEWARVYDRYYGSRKRDVLDLLEQGHDVLMVVDVQGARQIKEAAPDAVAIFLNAESPEVLMDRLARRDAGRTTNIEQRRDALVQELEYADSCDYTVINKEGALDAAVKGIMDIMDRS